MNKNLKYAFAGALALVTVPAGAAIIATVTGSMTVPISNSTLASDATIDTLNTYFATVGTNGVGGSAVSASFFNTCGWKPLAITDGGENVASVTETYIAEMFVPANTIITGVAVVNATAVAGNITVGLADSTGAPIAAAKSATTAASGTAAYQRVPFAAPYAAKGPQTYYVMLQADNTGYKFRTHTVGNCDTQKLTAQTYGTFTAFTPATTFTTAVGPVAGLY